MTIQENQIIGQLVATDYRSATVFKNHGIDFCCQGNRTIADACLKNNIDPRQILEELNKNLAVVQDSQINFNSWPLDLLTDYIEKKHHRYVTNKSAEIRPYLEKICRVHGPKHTELLDIRDQFYASVAELTMHMKKEETILFPAIRNLVSSNSENNEAPFINIEQAVEMMKQEHLVEGERFRKISELSNTYTPPEDACNTYCVTFALLKEFEEDLHNHIHLENNILFPQALEVAEKQFQL